MFCERSFLAGRARDIHDARELLDHPVALEEARHARGVALALLFPQCSERLVRYADAGRFHQAAASCFNASRVFAMWRRITASARAGSCASIAARSSRCSWSDASRRPGSFPTVTYG